MTILNNVVGFRGVECPNKCEKAEKPDSNKNEPTPPKDDNVDKKDNKQEQLIRALTTLAILNSGGMNTINPLPAPVYTVPPMTVPGVPGGIMA